MHSIPGDGIERGVSGPEQMALLVEDDPSLARLTAVWLNALGYRVETCDDGRVAAGLASRMTTPIDLLLTDVMLPGMRGPVLAGLVRIRHPAMAVLYTSGYSPELVGEVFGPYADTALLLRKPFTFDQLSFSVRQAVAHRPTARRTRIADPVPENVPDPA